MLRAHVVDGLVDCNAFTIQLIISKGESESIRHINKTLGFLKFKGPWSEPIVRAAGRTLRRDQLEHEIIRRSPTKNRVDVASRMVNVSLVFTRYREDFGT